MLAPPTCLVKHTTSFFFFSPSTRGGIQDSEQSPDRLAWLSALPSLSLYLEVLCVTIRSATWLSRSLFLLAVMLGSSQKLSELAT